MKKIILSIILSGIVLNPLNSMQTQEKETKQVSTQTQKTEQIDPAMLQETNKKLDAVLAATEKMDAKKLANPKTRWEICKAYAAVLVDGTAKTAANLNIAFNWVAARIDTILTKNGAIKAAIILSPLIIYLWPYLGEGLQKMFQEGKESVNKVVYEVEKMKAEVEIKTNAAKTAAPFSSWTTFGQTAGLGAVSGFGAGLALVFKTMLEGLTKKRLKL